MSDTPAISPPAQTRVQGLWNGLWDLLKLLLIVLCIKGCVIDQYTIPSGSMEPTLHGDERFLFGDRVLVNKWIYGPRIPFTALRLWNWQTPKRWDIVVFLPKKGTSDFPRLVKRVVGLPGERVRIRNGGIEINGEAIPFPDSLPKDQHYFNDFDLMQLQLMARTPEEQSYWRSVREKYPLKYGVVEDDEYLLVPEDQYLLLGDNSLFSVDGRVFGFVPRDNLLGPAFAVWWPWPHRRDFSGFSHTWWGMLLLYGLPAAFLALELISRKRAKARTEKTEETNFPSS